VNEQRCQNTRNLLRDDRKALLDEVGFVWKVGSKIESVTATRTETAKWNKFFRRLIEFKRLHNSFDVPCTDEEGALRMWCEEQKQLMRMGSLEEMRAQRLIAIGFCTTGEEKIFDNNYAKLKAFAEENDNSECEIVTLEDPELALWLICQRYLHKKRLLAPEREQMLTSLGVELDSTPIHMPLQEPKYSKDNSNNNNKLGKRKSFDANTTVENEEQPLKPPHSTAKKSKTCSVTKDTAIVASPRRGYLGLFEMAVNLQPLQEHTL
jgi:hypothetical protein